MSVLSGIGDTLKALESHFEFLDEAVSPKEPGKGPLAKIAEVLTALGDLLKAFDGEGWLEWLTGFAEFAEDVLKLIGKFFGDAGKPVFDYLAKKITGISRHVSAGKEFAEIRTDSTRRRPKSGDLPPHSVS